MQRKHVFQPTTPDPLEERLVLSAGNLASLDAVHSLAVSPKAHFRHVEHSTRPHSHGVRSLAVSPAAQSRHVPHSIAADHGAVRSPAVKLATAVQPFQDPHPAAHRRLDGRYNLLHEFWRTHPELPGSRTHGI